MEEKDMAPPPNCSPDRVTDAGTQYGYEPINSTSETHHWSGLLHIHLLRKIA